MKKNQTFSDIVNKIENLTDDVKITSLRKDILKIISESKNPISAYTILGLLKKSRPGSEPPTVYRVIDYFLEKKIIHKIDSDNTYVMCSHLEEVTKKEHGVLLTCLKCNASEEVYEENFFNALKLITKRKQFQTDCPIIQVKGICVNCKNLL
jgi:Fur family zinc uptake transcriptional regulator